MSTVTHAIAGFIVTYQTLPRIQSYRFPGYRDTVGIDYIQVEKSSERVGVFNTACLPFGFPVGSR